VLSFSVDGFLKAENAWGKMLKMYIPIALFSGKIVLWIYIYTALDIHP
jgi:hypothetical protein